MSYCTQSDIISRRVPESELIQLTDDADTGLVNTDVVDDIISEADELIDGFLRHRYDLPLSPVPGLLTGIAVDLCVYALYQRRAHVDTPETIIAGHKNAMKLLASIQRGELTLGVSAAASETSRASFDADTRVTGRDNLEGLL